MKNFKEFKEELDEGFRSWLSKTKRKDQDNILSKGTITPTPDDKFAVADTKVGGWKRTFPTKAQATEWADAWNKEYGHKEKVKVVKIR